MITFAKISSMLVLWKHVFVYFQYSYKSSNPSCLSFFTVTISKLILLLLLPLSKKVPGRNPMQHLYWNLNKKLYCSGSMRGALDSLLPLTRSSHTVVSVTYPLMGYYPFVLVHSKLVTTLLRSMVRTREP